MTTDEVLTKGERTRQAVLEAAYGLFLEQGYSATSMRQIAERAGVALGGIYNHFASKDEIFQALVIAKHPYLQIFPILRAVPGETAEEFLANATQVIEAEMGRRPEFMKLMFIELVEFGGRHFGKLIEVILPEAAPLLARFSNPQSGTRPLPPLLILRTFLGCIIGFYVTSMLMNGPGAPEPLRQVRLGDFVDIYLHGILAQPTSENQ